MTRTLPAIALACAVGALGLSAQGMKHVDLKDAKGNVVGMVMISAATGGGIAIDIDVKGVTPGVHAIHLHAVPKCEAPFTSAGPHFNPGNKKHGLQSPDGAHAGDMANFTVAANGTAKTTVTNKNATMAAGANSIYASGGTALVIHAAADDGKTDPDGAAGDRIICGAITK